MGGEATFWTRAEEAKQGVMRDNNMDPRRCYVVNPTSQLPRIFDACLLEVSDPGVLARGTLDAINTLRKRGAFTAQTRFVPEALHVRAMLIQVKTTAAGFDLSPFDRLRFDMPLEAVDTRDLAWTPLSSRDGSVIGTFHLGSGTAPQPNQNWTVECVTGGTANAVLYWFDLDMGHGTNTTLDMGPAEARNTDQACGRGDGSSDARWDQLLYLLPEEGDVAAGDVVSVGVMHDDHRFTFSLRGAGSSPPDPTSAAVTCRPQSAEPLKEDVAGGGAILRWHWKMLQDEPRNQAYQTAIERAVQELSDGAVVLELGSGSGLLSLMAARECQARGHKATRIVACEFNRRIASASQDIVRINGFADIVRVVPELSYDVQVGQHLTQRADLLYLELFGQALLEEGILRIVKDARERLLKPAAQIIPCAATIYAVPISYYPSGAASLKAAGVRCGFWDTLLSPDLGPLFVDLMHNEGTAEGDMAVRSLLARAAPRERNERGRSTSDGPTLGTQQGYILEGDPTVLSSGLHRDMAPGISTLDRMSSEVWGVFGPLTDAIWNVHSVDSRKRGFQESLTLRTIIEKRRTGTFGTLCIRDAGTNYVPLAEAQQAFHFNFSGPGDFTSASSQLDFCLHTSGTCNALAFYFELEMTPGQKFSTSPNAPATHWEQSVCFLPVALSATRAGTTLAFIVAHDTTQITEIKLDPHRQPFKGDLETGAVIPSLRPAATQHLSAEDVQKLQEDVRTLGTLCPRGMVPQEFFDMVRKRVWRHAIEAAVKGFDMLTISSMYLRLTDMIKGFCLPNAK
ncbi:hypothetical protein CYMTET_56018 [Cymbomonas tetramitiformis]|uniref:Protein arginine N-methyltransferase domain-containing protein n=1 Tax=Cymbomonas tetramitiformis TaxID=36881 RepID=A0AAE0EME2_9CHLO|nr:hypothetical protein CYMTET_56018 [Cymbomonas tetramitiformis]